MMTTRSVRPSVVGGNRKWNPAVRPNWSRARKTASMRRNIDQAPGSVNDPGRRCSGLPDVIAWSPASRGTPHVRSRRDDDQFDAEREKAGGFKLRPRRLGPDRHEARRRPDDRISLGILAEAAHSALDLVAALVTLLAVRVSDTPADREHPYGHGKIENFSALIETVLLFVTCVWIIYEAVQRLFFQPAEVDPSLWAFLVVIISIGDRRHPVPDALPGRAKKYQSQALEADALHFSTDVWSSSGRPRRPGPGLGRQVRLPRPSAISLQTRPTPWPPWASPSSSSSSAIASASGRSTFSSTARPTG